VTRAIRLVLVAAFALIGTSALWWHGQYRGDYDVVDDNRLAWLACLITLVWIGLYLAGVPELARTRAQVLARFARALVFTFGLFSVLQFGLASIVLPRLVVAVTFAGSLVVGVLILTVASRNQVQLRVGVLSGDDLTRSELSDFGVETTAIDRESVDSAAIDVLVFSQPTIADESLAHVVAVAHAAGIQVRTLLAYFEEQLGCVPRYALDDAALLADVAEIHNPVYARCKRAGDVAAAIVLIPVLVVAVPVVALLNLLGNRGTVLFVQERVGRDGSPFHLVKFRTMRAEGDRSKWTTTGDARIPKLGRLYRRLHVDELPQIVNILMGQMSFVGPRPEQTQYVESLSDQLAFYGARHRVRPGITGWAQVHQSYAASVDESATKLQYDLYYIRNQSLLLDASILVRTFASVLGLRGR
jgi:lipopolysaccharide/colanic/teichoic acid biosynthesis glycosyltransferase